MAAAPAPASGPRATLFSSPTPLAGHTVLVTGAARRLGRVFALAAAAAGADVVLHYFASPPATADAVAAEVRARGCRALTLRADLSAEGGADELADLLASAHWAHVEHARNSNTEHAGSDELERVRVTMLVNSAASFPAAGFSDTTPELWHGTLALNLSAPVRLMQRLTAVGCVRVVNVLDWRAARPRGRKHFAYCVAKAALLAATRAAADALSPTAVVNALALGAVLPPAVDDSGDDAAATAAAVGEVDHGDTQDCEGIIAEVPAARWAREQEVADALLLLLVAPTYVTGEVVHVDGGRHLV